MPNNWPKHQRSKHKKKVPIVRFFEKSLLIKLKFHWDAVNDGLRLVSLRNMMEWSELPIIGRLLILTQLSGGYKKCEFILNNFDLKTFRVYTTTTNSFSVLLNFPQLSLKLRGHEKGLTPARLFLFSPGPWEKQFIYDLCARNSEDRTHSLWLGESFLL